MAGDRVQFSIDVVSQVQGTTATTAELESISRQLTATGTNAEDLQGALERVAEQLTAARAASDTANGALSDGERRYRELESAALKAQRAFEKAHAGGDVDAATKLAKAASDAEYALYREAHALDELRSDAKAASAAVEKLTATESKLAQAQAHVTGKHDRNARALQNLRAGLGDLPGPLGQLSKNVLEPVQALEEMSSAFGATRAGAIVAGIGIGSLIVVVAALGAAAVAAVASMTALGVGLANTARQARLSNEAFAASEPALAGYTEAARAAVDATELSDQALRGLAKQLVAAKVSAEDMPAALMAAATAEAALGTGGAAKFIAEIKDGKRSVQSFANEVDAKFGGNVARSMLGLEVQSARLKRNLGKTFGGLVIDPLLEGLSTLVKLFDENESAGKALKFVFESIFQPIVDGITKAIPMIEAFFIGLLIGALKVYLAFKPLIKSIEEFLGVDDDSTVNWLTAAKLVAEALVFVIGGMTAAFLLTTAVITGFVAAVVGIPIAVGAAMAAFVTWIAGGITAAVEWFQTINWQDVGFQMMQGLANGITGARDAVLNAITGTVKGAIDAAKKMLLIASPSKVFEQIGAYTGEGMAIGIEDSSEDSQTAMADLATPPPLAEVATTPAATGGRAVEGGGSGTTINIGTINLYGVEGETSTARLAEALTLILQGDATQAAA